MLALRLARPTASAIRSLPSISVLPSQHRAIATTAPSPEEATVIGSGSGSSSGVNLSNIEQVWVKLSKEEQVDVHNTLEELQKGDWKTLSLDQRKAAYYVAFGPHGPRTPHSKPGDNFKIFLSTVGLMGVAGILFATARYFGGETPRTVNKEWEEASNKLALEQKINPITGISSEGYKGKGFVQSK